MPYTYAYLREDRTPYYIGKGNGKRAYVPHIRRNGNFIPVPDKDRILILKHFNTDEEAHKHEEYMIDVYGREIDGGILLNLCVGGVSRAIYTEEERVERARVRSNEYYHNNDHMKEYTKLKQREYRERPEYRERQRELARVRYRKNYDPVKRREKYLAKKAKLNELHQLPHS